MKLTKSQVNKHYVKNAVTQEQIFHVYKLFSTFKYVIMQQLSFKSEGKTQ